MGHQTTRCKVHFYKNERGETAMEIIRTTTQAEVRGCGTAHWAKQRE